MGKSKRYGNWQVLSSLGEGGQAWTYCVRHQNGREAVLKLVKNPKREWRFKREVMALNLLQSPNIPTFVEYGESEGRPWIVTENCGQPLLKMISEATSLQRLSWFCDIVLATRDAHQSEIIHRDIKPNNVVISVDKSTAYLIDFGICAIADSDSSLTTLEALGNAAFAAPECALGYPGKPKKASDIYSLGKVFYWLMSDGKPIFREDTHELEGTLIHLSTNIETRVLSIIRACIKESPQFRPTAEELLTRAQNLLIYSKQIIQEEERGLYRIIDNFGNNDEFNFNSSRGIISPGLATEDLHPSEIVAGLQDNRIQAEMVENKATKTLGIYRIIIGVSCLSLAGKIHLSLVEDFRAMPSAQELGKWDLDLVYGSVKISSFDCDIEITPGRFWILLKPADLPKTYVNIHAATNDVAPRRSIFAESSDGGLTWERRESANGSGIAIRIYAKDL